MARMATRRTAIMYVIIALMCFSILALFLNTITKTNVHITYNLLKQKWTTNSVKKINLNCVEECKTGQPCDYRDEVDFRIIVITYNRPKSLKKTLNALLQVNTLDDKVSVEIWVDRSPHGTTDNKTLAIANEFAYTYETVYEKGRVCIHQQSSNAKIGGQWIDTWRPKPNTSEIALILEDDISVAPMCYKWLKLVHSKYDKSNGNEIAGYTLQMENVKFFAGKHHPIVGPAKHPVFLSAAIGTWGFSPNPTSWIDFQNWYHDVRPDRDIKTDKIKPYVPGILPTKWYKGFEARHSQENMWSMWHLKYTELRKQFTVYSNLKTFTRSESVLLSNNRKEKGLHYKKDQSVDNSKSLLSRWKDDFNQLPAFQNLAHFNYDGTLCSDSCCFSTMCKGLNDL